MDKESQKDIQNNQKVPKSIRELAVEFVEYIGEMDKHKGEMNTKLSNRS